MVKTIWLSVAYQIGLYCTCNAPARVCVYKYVWACVFNITLSCNLKEGGSWRSDQL